MELIHGLMKVGKGEIIKLPDLAQSDIVEKKFNWRLVHELVDWSASYNALALYERFLG